MGSLLQIPCPRIVAGLGHPQFQQPFRRLVDDGADGVQAIDEIALGISHRRRPSDDRQPRPPRPLRRDRLPPPPLLPVLVPPLPPPPPVPLPRREPPVPPPVLPPPR